MSNGFLGEYQHIFSPNINLIVGVNYVLKERWVFSVEALPYFRYDVITESTGANLGVVSSRMSYGINMTSVRLVIADRFGSKES